MKDKLVRRPGRGYWFYHLVWNRVSILPPCKQCQTGYLFLAIVLNRVWFWVKCVKQGIKNRTIFVLNRVRVWGAGPYPPTQKICRLLPPPPGFKGKDFWFQSSRGLKLEGWRNQKSTLYPPLVTKQMWYVQIYIQWNLDLTNLYLTNTSIQRAVFFAPVIVKYHEKEPRFNERIWPVPSDFVKSRLHCTTSAKICSTKFASSKYSPMFNAAYDWLTAKSCDLIGSKCA